MASTAKALQLRDDLASELAVRLASIAQTKGFAADSAPTLLLGTGATTTDSVFIKITPIETLQKDVLGLTQTVFTPHVAQVVIEANYEATNDNVLDVGTWSTRLAVLGCLIAKGIRVELYVDANGDGAAAAGIAAANLKAAFEISAQYPLMASI